MNDIKKLSDDSIDLLKDLKIIYKQLAAVGGQPTLEDIKKAKAMVRASIALADQNANSAYELASIGENKKA